MDDGYWSDGYWQNNYWLEYWPLYWIGVLLSVSVHDCSDTEDLMN